MAKICKPIVEYKDIISSSGIALDDYSPPRKPMKRFIRLFRVIEDIRLGGMIDYPLYEVILIAFLAILGNASSWTEMERFGIKKQKWLKKFLKLKNGIPSHDTFRRVFGLIDPIQLEHATVLFLMENMAAIKKSLNIKDSGPKLICIDGNEEKGTGRKYGTKEEIRNLQIFHVYDASDSICLCSRPIGQKTNEIPAAQEVLKALQLKDTIVTFDALHTQKETIRLIVEQKDDYVGALKGNQGTLEQEANDSFSEEIKKKIITNGKNYYETCEKAHNQVETRRFYLIKANHTFNGAIEWQNLRNFICYEKKIYNIVTEKGRTEIRYYITSLRDIEMCADAVRGHWSVENQLHWHLDYSFYEDDNTTADRNAFTNLSLINKMVLSLCKLAQPLLKNRSIRTIRKEFSWDFEDSLAMILNAFDENSLKNALENAHKATK